MQLDEYLTGIETCPDETIDGHDTRLNAEYGISDNYPILTRGSFRGLLGFLRKLDFVVVEKQWTDLNKSIYGPEDDTAPLFDSTWQLLADRKVKIAARRMLGHYPKRFILHYRPGTIEIQALQYLPIGTVTSETHSPGDFARQVRDYNSAIIVHAYQKKRIPDCTTDQAMILGITLICRQAIKESRPICLPYSPGHCDDPSRRVYFP